MIYLLYCPCITFAVHFSSLIDSLCLLSFSLLITSPFKIPSLVIIVANLEIIGLVPSLKYVVKAFSSHVTTSSILCRPPPPFSLPTYNLSTSPCGWCAPLYLSIFLVIIIIIIIQAIFLALPKKSKKLHYTFNKQLIRS